MKTYKAELIGAGGNEIVTVTSDTSESPLSPVQIKRKLIDWISNGWELVDYWECTNYLEGYSVNAINEKTKQAIDYYSSFCRQTYLLDRLEQELEECSTESEFNPDDWTISIRPQIKIIHS